MAKDEKHTEPARPAKMINVERLPGDAHGGPTKSIIPETSLPAWERNGWKAVKE